MVLTRTRFGCSPQRHECRKPLALRGVYPSMGANSCTSACQVIRAASTEAEVIGAVRGYLSGLDSAQLKAIPSDLLSLHIHHARDIASAAIELARHEATISQE